MIEWAYMRNGWVSCKKAQQFFEQKKVAVPNITDARKEKIDADQAWEIFSKAEQVTIGKGKKSLVFAPGQGNKEAILKAAMGRSGNLRAPSLKIKGCLYIGFNDTIYDQI